MDLIRLVENPIIKYTGNHKPIVLIYNLPKKALYGWWRTRSSSMPKITSQAFNALCCKFEKCQNQTSPWKSLIQCISRMV